MMERDFNKELTEWIKSITIALAVVFFIKFLICDIVVISGISMEPTVYNRDRVFIDIIGYKLSKPKHSDIIVFTPSIDKNSYYIKRVIGVPGDTVTIKNGKVYVNQKELKENYLPENTYTEGSITVNVPEGTVFVLGDNRSNSEDSRDPRLGPVPIKSIKGHALFRVFPFNKIKKL